MHTKRIAVTAASGLLGRAVLAELIALTGGENLVAVVRNPETINDAKVAVRPGDYDNETEMAAALNGVDTLLMISAPIVPNTDRLAQHTRAINAARTAGVRKIVYTSVIGDDADHRMLYWPTQQVGRATEALIKNSGMTWVIARNGLYMDLDLAHIRRAADGDGIYRNNAGSGRCGYISVAELSIALAALVCGDQFANETVNLISENLTQAELVSIANDVFGTHVVYQNISIEQCLEKFHAMPDYVKRGEDVITMLVGCFECIAHGLFEVSPDFEYVVGRPAKSIREQLAAIRDKRPH